MNEIQPGSCQGDSHVSIDGLERLLAAIQMRVIGKGLETEQLLIALAVEGHCLMEGAAGTAKSALAECFAQCLGLNCRHITLTPDLEVLEFVEQLSTFDASPAHILVADGIDQCSPKLQAVIVSAMSDRMVRYGREQYRFHQPFLVLATHGPSSSTTNSIPLGQADRFLFQIPFRYPSYSDEYSVFQQRNAQTVEAKSELKPVVLDLNLIRQQMRACSLPPDCVHYALRLVRSTRVYEGEDHDFILEFVSQGAGPRAVESLLSAARARAVLRGRMEVTPQDIQSNLHAALRHRMVLNSNAVKNGVTIDQIIDRLLRESPEQTPPDSPPPALPAEVPGFLARPATPGEHP